MWWHFRGYTRPPFGEGTGPFVATIPHETAISEILGALGDREPEIDVVGPRGVGRSRVLREARDRLIADGHDPILVVADEPGQGLVELATHLDRRVSPLDGRVAILRLLREVLRVRRWLGSPTIVLLDADLEGRDLHDWQGLVRSELLMLVRSGDEAGSAASTGRVVEIPRLTRRETARYLLGKIEAAGGRTLPFEEGAIDVIHAWTAGLPRSIDRLSTAALARAPSDGGGDRPLDGATVERCAEAGLIRLGLAGDAMDC